MAKIFISYSRADSSIVDNLFVKLQSAGHSIWVDRVSIQGGDQWRRQIVSAIETSDVFILVLSPNSIKSKNVRKELDLAEETDIQIIPIEIKPTNIPTEMKYQLVGLQRIDFSSSFDKGYEALLSAIDKNPILEMDALQMPIPITSLFLPVVASEPNPFPRSRLPPGCIPGGYLVPCIFRSLLYLVLFSCYTPYKFALCCAKTLGRGF